MDLITRHSADGRIRFASPASQAMLGRAPATLLGLAPSALVYNDDLKTMQAAFVEASYFGRAATAEVRLKLADGGYLWTEMRCRPAAPVNGEAADIVAVTRDISERKAHEIALIDARDAAEGANKAKSSFLANMSHELRTPLNAILGFSEVMKDQHLGPVHNQRYLSYAGDIHSSGRHLLAIINDVLDLAKIEAGKMTIDNAALFELAPVLASSLAMLKGLGEKYGVTVHNEMIEDGLQIKAVERMIRQIVINLVGNAIKFTPAGGTVHLSGRLRSDGGYEIAVRDTGVGMSEKEMAHAMMPFGQNDNRFTGKHDGTGLGLPLAKAMLELHDGALTMSSIPDIGTTVTMILPPERVEARDLAAA
jgi:cell cycle sensor histidine kinase DivJ